MRRSLYLILIITIILGTTGLIPAVANDYTGHLHEAAIEYVVTEAGLWTAGGDFGPDQAATRAQTASVMARLLSDLRPPYAVNFSDVDASGIYAGDITLATNLGIVSGSNGKFRPDDAITREEFAIMLVRAYEIAGHEIFDTNYATEFIKDYDSISDWAKTSVTNAIGNGIMLNDENKVFNPAGTVTRAELAASVYALHCEEDINLSYTEEIVTSPDLTDFTVINTASYVFRGHGGFGVIARYDEGGPGEIYIKRDKVPFTPGNNNLGETVCYVKVTDPDGNTICRVDINWLEEGVMEKIITIPDGPAGIYQIQVNNGIMNNHYIKRDDSIDTFSVGIKGYKSWGFRGEDSIIFMDDTLPLEGYIYVPEKVDFLTLGTAGGGRGMGGGTYVGSGTTFTLYDEDNSSKMVELTSDAEGLNLGYSEATIYADSSKNQDGQTAIKGDTVYKYVITPTVPNTYKGRLGITGITPVIYPNAEYAMDLKSGYIQHTDDYITNLQLAGPLQKRARERMVEIYEEMKEQGNENFTVDISDKKPNSVPDDLDNPLAEASLFGPYGGSITNVQGQMDTQCLDPSNPWFGAILSRNRIPYDVNGNGTIETNETVYPEWTGKFREEDYPFYEAGATTAKDWQTAHYLIDTCSQPFTGAISINSELNAYYNNPTLIKRAELVLLYLVTQAPADGMFVYNRDEKIALGELHVYEQFFFGHNGLANAYYFLRKFLSPETRYITDAGILNNCDKIMNFTGQGQSNHLLMGMASTVWTYAWSGMEPYHDQAINNITQVAKATSSIGQSPLGFFYEAYGADGNSGSGYGAMCEGIWGEIVYAYLNLPESRQDPALKASIIETTELNLVWDSYFYKPSTSNFSAVHSTNWTTRNDIASGAVGTADGKTYYMNIFPRAKKNLLVAVLGTDYKNYSTSEKTTNYSKHLVSEPSALKYFEKYFSNYGNYYYTPCANPDTCNLVLHAEKKTIGHGGLPEEYRPKNSLAYHARHQDQIFEDSEMPILPFEMEGDENIILNENGIVAVKHKGLYMLNYFNHAKFGHFSGTSWIGGGPTAIWDDYFASTLVGKKPTGWSRFSFPTYKESTDDYTTRGFLVDDIKHSCIVGTDANGKIFISGKENSKFSWIEEKKSFKLSGQQKILNSNGETIQDKTVTWKYYLTDKGIAIDGGIENLTENDDFYMQLPILVQNGANYTFDEENCRIVIEHNGNQIVYRWAENATVSLSGASTDTKNANNFKYLRIKLTTRTPMATVWVERTLAS